MSKHYYNIPWLPNKMPPVKHCNSKDHLLGLLHVSMESTSKLLDNLLTWARTQTGAMTFEPQQISLRSVVEENTRLLQAMALEKGITLAVSVPEEAVVFANREMLSTVVRNLVSNAIKYKSPDRSPLIRIKMEISEGFTCFLSATMELG